MGGMQPGKQCSGALTVCCAAEGKVGVSEEILKNKSTKFPMCRALPRLESSPRECGCYKSPLQKFGVCVMDC